MPVWDENTHREGTEEEWAFKSRTFTGQVVGVDEENGRLSVRLLGSTEKFDVDAPVQGLSVNGVRSAWQRHMPSVKDYVDLSFGADNRPHLHRVVSWKFRNDSGGWADITKAANAGDGNLGLIWRKLRQGEFDLRSSGGAGYYFTADGHATIQAGPTSIELDKNRSESIGNAGLWVRRGDGVEVRFGDVKRSLPLTFEETKATPNPVGAVAPKEWFVEVGYPTPPAGLPKLVFYREQAGDVRSAILVPELHSGTALPLRYRRELYDASGLVQTLSVEVDALGNTKVTQSATAVLGGIDVSMAASPLSVRALRSSISAVTTNVIASSLPAAGVFLGSATAFEAVIKGTTYAAAFVPQVTAQGALYTALATFLGAYLAENPTSPSGIAAGTAGGLATAAIALTTALAAAMAPGAALSVKVLTE